MRRRAFVLFAARLGVVVATPGLGFAQPQGKTWRVGFLASIPGSEEFEGAFATMAQERVDAIFIVPSSVTLRGRDAPVLLAELAMKHRLPSMFGYKASVVAGGLMSYSPNYIELTRLAATYIDKILKGAKPADLPVEQATRFELVINMKTAKALGLTIPPTLLAFANEVIE